MAKRFLKSLLKVLFCISLFTLLYDYYNGFALLKHLKKRKNLENFRDSFAQQFSFQSFKASNSTSFCPNTSLKYLHIKYDYTLQKCRPIPVTESDCHLAIRKYGRTPKDRDCRKNEPQQVITDLCKFNKYSRRTATTTKLELTCDLKPCGNNPIYVGVIEASYGLPLRTPFQYAAKTENEIKEIINKIVESKAAMGLDFCTLYCQNKNMYIKQALIFPPFIKIKKATKTSTKESLFNINIVVLDSVSRQHFYRQLPDTVQQLRWIADNENVEVLDYEMFQSIAPRTFPNMRAVFSGIVDIDSDDEIHSYGLESLFGKYNNMGFQTMLQEDSCWFDPWGAIITDNKHYEKVLSHPSEYKERWEEIQGKLRHLPIHSYGLTHFSCDVFLQYGKTNQFNDPPKVCYNGHLLPAYFLNYTYDILKSTEIEKDAFPAFLYTHLNAGHETTGKRIAYADGILSDFILKISELENTLTILMSDHGPKTTRFSQEFLAGRYEIGHAAMFLLIPHGVQLKIRKLGMNHLRTNQHRFVSHLDLFHTLISIHDSQPTGLLRPISAERDCSDVPIYSFMTCLCNGWMTHLLDQDTSVHWLAEYAVGQLNNKITFSRQNYYGRCERLIGKRFDKIRMRRNLNNHTIYVFDVVVEKYRNEEIFEIVVSEKQFATSKPIVELTKWRRVSIFQHYQKCRDSDVDITLCICRKESSSQDNDARDLAKLLSMNFFEVESKTTFLDSKCLLIITRFKESVFRTYELSNECVDRIYNVSMSFKTNENIQASVPFPKNITVRPWLIYHVTSINLVGGLKDPAIENVNISFSFVKKEET